MTGKTAIVTGGSRGIGRAICIHLAQQGANIVINYAGNEAAANETAKICKAHGVKTMLYCTSVANAEACIDMCDKAVAEFGRIDILVNNAGITRDGLLMRMSESDFDEVINTNLKGAFNMMKAVSRIMMKARSGRIINISSVVGLMGNAGQVNYAASKAGLIGMTKSLARELASRNVTVNAVAPGFIETDMTKDLPEGAMEKLKEQIPLARLGKTEDVAAAVAYLASDAAGYITGQVLSVDGGMCMR